MAVVIGTTNANAPMPITGMRTRKISSVAYAEDERLSEANTASAVGLPKRSCSSCSVRSEEHTSELQSRQYLVCRLLLEKKKKEGKNGIRSRCYINTRVSN